MRGARRGERLFISNSVLGTSTATGSNDLFFIGSVLLVRVVAIPDTLGIIAGNGVYPRLLADSARRAGVKKIVAAAFTGETDPALTQHVDLIEWMRVGQLGRLLKFFRDQEIHRAIMAGQIAPKNLFDLRPDWKALLLLGKLKAAQRRIDFRRDCDRVVEG